VVEKDLKWYIFFFLNFLFSHFFPAFGAPHGAPSFPAPQLILLPLPLRLEPEKQIQKNQA